ncbi:serine/threonine protein kinase [Streptomyces thermolilacinus SPC6]|uniref:Serine/threonine protein kinase n=2 Tax=Streptomyces thermolilacinus TaxID=285540 RepID=A0A1D3DSZ8_9ACTN|nr:metallophosphoesterase [Streptomyces thermolilacinus]OEJ95457.1 serine/threonine protein kinase [Streptomyces thermolilacinus SPC6]
MTQGAGQGPVVRTATLRDFRVPPYAQVPVQGHSEHPQPQQPQQPAPPQPQQAPEASEQHVPPQPHQPSAPAVQPPAAQPQAQAQPPAPQPPAAQQPPAPHQQSVTPRLQAPQLPHPGNAFPDDDYPEGYTPTERDLPVINRGDTLQVTVTPPPAPAAAPATAVGQGPGPLYVVGDVHGYLDELLAALREQGLIDGDGHWSAGNTRLWFLGDFTDRGPDGIGVIDLVMRLSAEAAAAGGYCKALMGNHELLLLGAKRFGDTPVNSGAGTATFQAAWLLNGGQKSDMDRLQDVHLQWMSRLDAIVEQDGHLLLHSDTTAYLEYGDTIEDVNDTIHEILTRNDADECWDLFRKFTKRFAFRDEGGANAVRELLAAYGGERVVHGHSPIPYLLGEVGTEDADGGSSGPVVEGPHVYADGLAIAMDGGVTMAGKLLVQQLPLPH